MRIIYNEDLNKRIIPYVDKLIKNKKKLDKETAVLFDVFIQYLDMDTRYGTYGEQLEPCIRNHPRGKYQECRPSF